MCNGTCALPVTLGQKDAVADRLLVLSLLQPAVGVGVSQAELALWWPGHSSLDLEAEAAALSDEARRPMCCVRSVATWGWDMDFCTARFASGSATTRVSLILL